MRKALRWRYYCEFCKKSGNSASHMAHHEAHCTGNPKRICGYCKEAGRDQDPMSVMIAVLTSKAPDYDAGLELLRDLTENCPACILAAIRQSGVQKADDEEGGYVHVNFDFKKEKETFWSEVNESRMEREYQLFGNRG